MHLGVCLSFPSHLKVFLGLDFSTSLNRPESRLRFRIFNPITSFPLLLLSQFSSESDSVLFFVVKMCKWDEIGGPGTELISWNLIRLGSVDVPSEQKNLVTESFLPEIINSSPYLLPPLPHHPSLQVFLGLSRQHSFFLVLRFPGSNRRLYRELESFVGLLCHCLFIFSLSLFRGFGHRQGRFEFLRNRA